MTKNFPFKILKVSGSNYDIGFQIGSKFKDKIKDAFNRSKKFKFLKNVDEFYPQKFNRLNKIGQKHFPQYVEEIRGIAEGSGIEYRDIAIMNFMAEYPEGCTTIVLKQNDKIILGHNEDGPKENLENSFLTIVKPKVGIPFFSFCYPGWLPSGAFSFNLKGLIQTGNWLPTPDVRVGIPRHLIDRYLLEAKNVDDALKRSLLNQRASGYSYIIASSKRAVNLETTSHKYCITEIIDKYVQTNHYVSNGLKHIEQKIYPSSLIRYEKVIKILECLTDASYKEVLKILSQPHIFSKRSKDASCTLCTAIFEISNEKINLRVYPPKQKKKENECMKFSLNDLIN